MKKVERLIRIGIATILFVGYWLGYFVLRGVIAIRVWNTNTSAEIGLVYLVMCLFIAAGFLLFKPASLLGRLSLYLCTAVTCAATLMAIVLTVLPGGGHPSLGSIVYGLFGEACLLVVPLGLILLTTAFLAGEKFLFFGAGLVYFFGVSLYAFPIVGIDIPSSADKLLGTKFLGRLARHLDCRCPDYDELGQNITLLRKCRYLSEHRQYVLSVLAGRHPEHRGEVVREIHSQFAKINGEETKVRALSLLQEVHHELIPTAEISVDSVKFLQNLFDAPEPRVRETAFGLLLNKLEAFISRPEYDAVAKDLVRIYGEEQNTSKFYFFLDRAADEIGQWAISDAGRRHAITNLLMFVLPQPKAVNSKRYGKSVFARIEALQSINKDFERGGYDAVYQRLLAHAEQGDTSAMVSIGLLYQRGEGFKQDYQQAMDWYVKAFRTRDADAYNYIAALYRDGLGIPRDIEIACAIHWIANQRGFGSFAAKGRLQRGFGDVTRLLSNEQVQECRKINEAYVAAYVEKRGNLGESEKRLKFSN